MDTGKLCFLPSYKNARFSKLDTVVRVLETLTIISENSILDSLKK